MLGLDFSVMNGIFCVVSRCVIIWLKWFMLVIIICGWLFLVFIVLVGCVFVLGVLLCLSRCSRVIISSGVIVIDRFMIVIS